MSSVSEADPPLSGQEGLRQRGIAHAKSRDQFKLENATSSSASLNGDAADDKTEKQVYGKTPDGTGKSQRA